VTHCSCNSRIMYKFMIKVLDIRKTFKLYRDPFDRLKEAFSSRSFHSSFSALSGVSFDLQEGKVLGIIGPNGAGKSTLLKILTGVLLPDSGSVELSGRVTGLLELGTGFNYELSGSENIDMNAMLLGMDPPSIRQAREEIINFSELGEYIYEPLKTYSSGMVMRLGFAIAIHARPQCFIVDEALSVGDAYFQQKCIGKLKEFKQQGGSIIFVSHDMSAVKVLCDEALLLHKGRIVEIGAPEDVVNSYNFLLSKLGHQQGGMVLQRAHDDCYGSFDARILSVRICEAQSGETSLVTGEIACLEIKISTQRDIPELVVGFMLRDRFGQDIFGTNTHHLQKNLAMRKGEKATASFKFTVELAPGEYSVTAALHTNYHHLDDCMHWMDRAATFRVGAVKGTHFSGVCRLPVSFDFDEVS